MSNKSVIDWQPPVPGAPVVPVVLRESPEEDAPVDFPVPIRYRQFGKLGSDIVSKIQGALGGSGSKFDAALILEQEFGGVALRPDCIRIVKEIDRNTRELHKDVDYFVPIQTEFWMKEEHYKALKDLPNIECLDPSKALEKRPIIESNVEFPENYTGGLLNPDDGDVIPVQKQRVGLLTDIKSQAPEPNSAFPKRRGVRTR